MYMNIGINGKNYRVNEQHFLADPDQWDENFASGMASILHIPEGLSEKHWEVIRFIRDFFFASGRCPLVYEACSTTGLELRDLKRLFPTGYLRGACLLAGITYRGRLGSTLEHEDFGSGRTTYHVDVDGFLVDPTEWDEEYACQKALEMKVPGGLKGKHLQVIRFLRNSYRTTGKVPTVYECCEQNNIELDELARLFPDGYQRGAVKLAGLRTI